MLESVLGMTSFNCQTWMISEEFKHRETKFMIFYCMISSVYRFIQRKSSVLYTAAYCEQKKFMLRCASHACYTQQLKLDCVTYDVRWLIVTTHDDSTGGVSCAVAVSSGMQYQLFLNKNLKWYLIMCSPGVRCLRAEGRHFPTPTVTCCKLYYILYLSRNIKPLCLLCVWVHSSIECPLCVCVCVCVCVCRIAVERGTRNKFYSLDRLDIV